MHYWDKPSPMVWLYNKYRHIRVVLATLGRYQKRFTNIFFIYFDDIYKININIHVA